MQRKSAPAFQRAVALLRQKTTLLDRVAESLSSSGPRLEPFVECSGLVACNYPLDAKEVSNNAACTGAKQGIDEPLHFVSEASLPKRPLTAAQINEASGEIYDSAEQIPGCQIRSVAYDMRGKFLVRIKYRVRTEVDNARAAELSSQGRFRQFFPTEVLYASTAQ